MVKLSKILNEIQIGVTPEQVFDLWREIYNKEIYNNGTRETLNIFKKYGYIVKSGGIRLEDWLKFLDKNKLFNIHKEMLQLIKNASK